jgi:peptide/nickel transport system substrate-binding protein
MQAAWFGLAEVATGPVPAGMLGHRPKALVPPRGDRDKAQALLKASGISLPLRLSLDVDTRPQNLAAAQVIQWSLKKVGIEITLKTHENATFITLGREDLGADWRQLQLFLQNFIGMADPYYSITWFITAQLGLWNWERFSNAEFDQLNDAALATSDAAERDQMYQRMQDLMEQSGCYRFLTNGAMPLIYRNSVVPALRPDGYALFRDFRPSSGVS